MPNRGDFHLVAVNDGVADREPANPRAALSHRQTMGLDIAPLIDPSFPIV